MLASWHFAPQQSPSLFQRAVNKPIRKTPLLARQHLNYNNQSIQFAQSSSKRPRNIAFYPHHLRPTLVHSAFPTRLLPRNQTLPLLSASTAMETTHRKIELQSPLDLTYLHNNATSLLRSKLDLHFPPSAAPPSASDDVLKSRVEELVSAYLEKIFEDAKANLSINGLEGEEMEDAMKMAEGKGEGEFCAFSTPLERRKSERELVANREKNRTRTLRWKTRPKTALPLLSNRTPNPPPRQSPQRSSC